MLGFHSFKICDLHDNLTAAVPPGADQQPAGLESAPGHRLESLPHCQSQAAHHVEAETHHYGLTRDFPDDPTVTHGSRNRGIHGLSLYGTVVRRHVGAM